MVVSIKHWHRQCHDTGFYVARIGQSLQQRNRRRVLKPARSDFDIQINVWIPN
jgi:hypothetical protein